MIAAKVAAPNPKNLVVTQRLTQSGSYWDDKLGRNIPEIKLHWGVLDRKAPKDRCFCGFMSKDIAEAALRTFKEEMSFTNSFFWTKPLTKAEGEAIVRKAKARR